MKSSAESCSIIIPAYQEKESVGPLVSAVLKVAGALGIPFEVIVIDDGSSDGTGVAAGAAGAQVLTHPYNKGYGAALKTGIRHAQHRTVLFLDADGQHCPDDIPRLLQERGAYDMVVGAREGSSGSPLWRRPGKLALKLFANHLCGRSIPDLNSGLRALDRELALHLLPLMPDGFSFSTTSTIAALKAGYLLQYVSVHVSTRTTGASTVTSSDGWSTLMLIIRLITLFAPLKIFLPFSAMAFLVGVTFTVHGYLIHGVASLKGLIALLGALQLFLFGLMVDQIVAIRRGESIGLK